MKIASLTKLSTIDYPGVLAGVVFTNGCNFRCTYCHNHQLIDGRFPCMDNSEVMDYFIRRAKVLGGVVITGGEPTVQRGLYAFIKELKEIGYKVKLDTNGALPDVLSEVLSLVDYVALDYKAPQRLYSKICGHSGSSVLDSVSLLANSTTPWEVRTTLAVELDAEAIEELKGELEPLYTVNPPLLHRMNKLRLNSAAGGDQGK